MARRKRTSYREIQNIPFKDIDASRRSIPFLRRTEQQNVREGELTGRKSKFVRQAPIAKGNSGSVAANGRALIDITLTANDANVIIAWPQINIYIDTDDTLDSLWFKGDSVSATDALLSLGFVQLINTSAKSGLASNQSQMQGIFINRDSISHTYFVHVRWYYLIIE